MRITRDFLIKASFFIAISITIVLAFIDLTDLDKSIPLIITGIIATLTFIIIALSEVSGIIYIFSARKRIIQ